MASKATILHLFGPYEILQDESGRIVDLGWSPSRPISRQFSQDSLLPDNPLDAEDGSRVLVALSISTKRRLNTLLDLLKNEGRDTFCSYLNKQDQMLPKRVIEHRLRQDIEYARTRAGKVIAIGTARRPYTPDQNRYEFLKARSNDEFEQRFIEVLETQANRTYLYPLVFLTTPFEYKWGAIKPLTDKLGGRNISLSPSSTDPSYKAKVRKEALDLMRKNITLRDVALVAQVLSADEQMIIKSLNERIMTDIHRRDRLCLHVDELIERPSVNSIMLDEYLDAVEMLLDGDWEYHRGGLLATGGVYY